jgi:transposase
LVPRVHVEGQPVSLAARGFGFSRPAVYQALSVFEQGGLAALQPQKPGPRRAHKLSEEVVNFLEDTRADMPHLGAGDLVAAIKERFDLSVHPRSIERALLRRKKKRR